MLFSNIVGLAIFALSCSAAHDAQTRKRAVGLSNRQSCPSGVDCASYDQCIVAADPCVDCECLSSIEPRPCPQIAVCTLLLFRQLQGSYSRIPTVCRKARGKHEECETTGESSSTTHGSADLYI